MAELLAERIDCGELTDDRAKRIGTQVMRDNALKSFPQLNERLWRHKAKP